jgi:pectate lyase
MTYNTSAEFDDVCVEDSGAGNTPTPTPTVTNTPTPTPATATPTPTPAATSTPTPTPSGATPTPTPSASGEPYPLLRPDDVPHTGPQQAPGTLPDGFASYGKGTTGGQGGTAVTVTTAAELVDYIKRDGAYIINVQGTIDLGAVALTGFDKTYGCFAMKSNKTLQGVGSGATILNGGVTAVGVSNIIIRNLNFTTNESGGGAEDAFCAASGAHHIWIDHCTFSNFADGLVDIKRWASFVTVSYCRFFNHSKTTLVGHDDSFDDTGYLKTTYHHNWFDATTQRHPRVRYGEVHVYNNYYNDLGDYGIGAGVQARIYSEYNYFENVEDCSQFYGTGYLKDIGSFMVNCETFETNPSGVTWNPQSYYSYTADPVANVKDLCIQYAGAGKPSR